MFRTIHRRAKRKANRRAFPDFALETRALLTVTSVTVSASPEFLRHLNPRNQPNPLPTGPFVPVSIAGDVESTSGRTPKIRYQVFDSLGHFQPSGRIRQVTPFNATKTRSFYQTRIGLILHRAHNEPLGRQYTIVVTARDGASVVSQNTTVIIPGPQYPSRLNARHSRRA